MNIVEKLRLMQTDHIPELGEAIAEIEHLRREAHAWSKACEDATTKLYKLYFDQIYEELILDDSLGLQAKSNTIENFKFGFEDKFMDTTISRMEQNQDIFTKMMNDKEFGNIVRDYMLKKVYQQLRK